MIEAFARAIGLNTEKLQLDIGNFSVGVATICLAVVTMFIALRGSRSSNFYRLAEFRQNWIDELRTNIGQFSGGLEGAMNLAMSHSQGQNRAQELDQKFEEIKRFESWIKLRLNPNERDHRWLTALVEQARSSASGFAVTISADLVEATHQADRLVIDFSRLIFKSEWDRVRDETFGRGPLHQYINRRWRAWSRRERERAVRNSVEVFLRSTNLNV